MSKFSGIKLPYNFFLKTTKHLRLLLFEKQYLKIYFDDFYQVQLKQLSIAQNKESNFQNKAKKFMIQRRLKEKFRVNMIHNAIRDNTSMNGVSYFFLPFSPSLCEVAYLNSRFQRNDVILLKRKRDCAIGFSPLNHCWPLHRVLMKENGDTATRSGLNFQIGQGTNGLWEARNVKLT